MHPSHSFLSHSFLWSGLLALALGTACNTPEPAHKAQPQPAGDAKVTPEAPKKVASASKPAPEIIEEIETVDRPADAKLAQKLTDEGLGVTKAIEDALAAANAGHKDDAAAALGRARTSLARLEADRPNVDIAVEVWREGKELEKAEVQGTVDTVPLLAMAMRMNVPVFAAKELEARHTARKDQAPAMVTAKEKKTDLEIIDANLVYEEIELPIAATKIDVLAAQELMAEGKLPEAADALRRALASFSVITLVEQAPEYRARQLVWDAKGAFVRGDMSEAKRLLAGATLLLDPLCEGDQDPQAKKMARMLLDELAPLRDVLKPDDGKQLDVLHRAERNARSLARRAAMRMMMAAHQEQDRFALADGLMWLERAQTEGLLEGKDGAGASLVLAEIMLDSAVQQSPPSAKPRLDDLHARLRHLIALDVATSRNAAEIKTEYRGVAHALRMLMLDLGFTPEPARG